MVNGELICMTHEHELRRGNNGGGTGKRAIKRRKKMGQL